MIILTIKTDQPQAEISLHDRSKQLVHETWEAHRQLAETLHTKIAKLLQSLEMDWPDIGAIAVFQGPGSFTGLRIGISVANALAFSLSVPVATGSGKDWQHQAISKLQSGKTAAFVVPEYGSVPHVTSPKK